jgi:hypothetical protein
MKHTFTIAVEIDPNWIDYLTRHSDIFGGGYAGYWLRGVEHDPKLGWLCWEDDEKCAHGEEPDREHAVSVWKRGVTVALPSGWFALDAEMAVRAWEEGVKRWGVNWYEETDSTREDIVVQLAMLGEIKYG